MPQFQTISVNIVGKPRFAAMEGRDYIVLPVVILMEGVHAGSNGPVFYALEDMEKFCPAWDNKPVVVFHPKDEAGNYISAANAAVMTASKVGILLNNRIETIVLSDGTEGKGQVAEAWLEKERIQAVDPRIQEAIDSGLVIEVSTGLFSTNEESEGEWNGEKYSSTAREYRPDHLALLPDSIGACSVADGCGMFTASESMSVVKAKRVKRALDKVISNELSHGELWSALYEKIQPPPTEYSWIDDVYDEYFIFCKGDKHYKQEYKTKGDTVELVGDPTEVERKITYNAQLQVNEEKSMSKDNCGCTKEIKALSDKLISANVDWKEENREWLEKQDKPILEKFVTMQEAKIADAAAKAAAEKQEETEEEEVPAPVSNKKQPPAANKKKKSEAEELKEFIDNSPAPIREMLLSGLQAQEANRQRYMDIILSNESNKFTKEELAPMANDMLEKLAGLAVDRSKEEKETKLLDLFNKGAFSFVGNGGAAPQNNSSQEILPLPTMNYGKQG